MPAIRALRILPPFAIARLGSSETAMDNYSLETTPAASNAAPLGYRKLVPRETLVLGDIDGEVEIVAKRVPEGPLQFKTPGPDGKPQIRPVAPFLEAFALVEGSDELQPLTTALLQESGFAVADVKWSVCVANRKVSRRTGFESDAVIAVATDIGAHKWVALEGRSPNFQNPATDSIDFGRVCFIKPNEDFPEIRLRFHPAKGLIYGPATASAPTADAASGHNQNAYQIPPERAIYRNPPGLEDGRGWQDFDGGKVEDYFEKNPGKGFFNDTLPPALFAISSPAPNWLFDNVAIGRGYLDDACDGFVELRLGPADKGLSAIARVTVGPPATAPDSLFVRTLADDLDQALLGPSIGEEDHDDTRARALDIVRRAFETVNFMNVAVMNGNAVNGRPALILDSMPEEEAADTERAIRPVMAPTSVDTFAIKMLHQHAYAAMLGGAAPWFARLLRRPDQVADYTDFGRRKMPALMCGADNNYLALTWRQIHTIERAAAAGPTTNPPKAVEIEAPRAEALALEKLKPRNLSAQLRYTAAGNPIAASPVTAVANCCPGLEVDFRAIWRRLFKGIELREYDNLVVRLWPDPEAAAADAHVVAVPGDFEPAETFEEQNSIAPVSTHKLSEMAGHRLLRVWIPHEGGEARAVSVVGVMKGPASSDLAGQVDLTTSDNPYGVAALEWSNALAQVMAYARKTREAGSKKVFIQCDFSLEACPDQQAAPLKKDDKTFIAFNLEVRPFFEDDTAVISRALARAGELTQGLCSPWQNDYRECSCYYWASARPDFVNVETDASGLSVGDNWMQRERTGRYVADDYKDSRLMMYDELFYDWETKLKFQVGGRDWPDP